MLTELGHRQKISQQRQLTGSEGANHVLPFTYTYLSIQTQGHGLVPESHEKVSSI